MKRPPIDRSQRVLSIHNLNVSIMSGVGYVLAFESAIFGQFQAQAAGDLAGLSRYTASRPICQVKQRWAWLVHFFTVHVHGKVFLEGAFHFVTFANIVIEVLE